ncbi:MAG: elongation factor G [Candidatus Poribacteria bacterium]|nr:elongation factor G [Candidatus Poribacteria bacterium]
MPKQYTTDAIRNVAVVAHANTGKTKLIEALLYTSGGLDRIGSVQAGTTVSDFDPDEIERKTTLAVTPIIAEWEGYKINLLDTPGYEDFYGELECALRVADSALILVDGESGVEGGTEKVWDAVRKVNLPRAVVINKLDLDGADYEKALTSIEEVIGETPVKIHIPIGAGASFKGIVDVFSMRAWVYAADGKTYEETDIPDDIAGLAEEAREALVEAAAEGEESLMEKYFDEGELTQDELYRGLRASIAEGRFVPALCCAAETGVGANGVLDFLAHCMPSPTDHPIEATVNGQAIELTADPSGPLAAFVFKTVYDPFAGRVSLIRVYSGTLKPETVVNARTGETERIAKVAMQHGKQSLEATAIVAGDIGSVAKLEETKTNDTLTRADKKVVIAPVQFSRSNVRLAVYPATDGDDDKLSVALTRLHEEDPTFIVERDSSTHETIISGFGEQHISVMLARAKRKYNASARTQSPKIAYRETISRGVKGVDYTHKKQSGGSGQYARVVIDVEPTPRGAGYEFVDKIFGGAIDQQYRPSVDKGIQQMLKDGTLIGFPIVDVRVTLVDGKTHPVDSKDIAFQTAGRGAFRSALEQAGVVLLEPIMSVEILCPDETMGDIIGDMNSRRGRVMGMDQIGRRQVIKAQVPLAELDRYQTDLKSMTSARGSFTMQLSHYEEMPRDQQEKVVAELRGEDE